MRRRKRADRQHRIFKHNLALFFRTHLLRPAESADKKFKLLLVFCRQMLKDQPHSHRVMRGFYRCSATEDRVTNANHEKELRTYFKAGDGLHVTAGKANVAQVPEYRRSAFPAAKLDPAGAVETFLISPAGWFIKHSSPY